MSSGALESYFQYLQVFKLLDYLAVIIITIVIYDYILTLPREIDYVWCRGWSRVSTLYILTRYPGIFLAITSALNLTTFAPGPLKTYVCALYIEPLLICSRRQIYDPFQGTAFFLAPLWVTPAFLAVSELVMIMRVYAMWNRSRVILGVLLSAYVPHIALAIVSAAIFSNVPFIVVNLPGMPYCLYEVGPATLRLTNLLSSIPRSIVGVLLLALAVSQTLRRSIGMYKATRQWQLNRYMKLFVKDGMLFFVLTMLTYTALAPSASSVNALSTSTIVLQSFTYLYYGPFVPHLIIGVRVLYDRESRGRSQGIDTGFGVSSHSTSSRSVVMSTIVFADTTPWQDLGTEGEVEDSELIECDTLRA